MKITKKISEQCNKFELFDYLWYVVSELVALSLFSDKVTGVVNHSLFEKMKMLDIFRKDLDDLVDESSMSA